MDYVDVFKLMIQQDIIRSVKLWGIEGTEDKIIINLKYHNKMRQLYLDNLHELYGFGGDIK